MDSSESEEAYQRPRHKKKSAITRLSSKKNTEQNDENHETEISGGGLAIPESNDMESSIVKLGSHMSHFQSNDIKLNKKAFDSQASTSTENGSLGQHPPHSLDQSINSQFQDMNMTSSTLDNSLMLFSSTNSLKRSHEKGSSTDDSGSDRPVRKQSAADNDLLNTTSSSQSPYLSQSRRLDRLDRLVQSAQNVSLLPEDSHSSRIEKISSSASLQSLTTSTMKNRTFLVGSMGASSALGAQELERLFPDCKLNVMVVTWNMDTPKNTEYPENLQDLLFPSDVEFSPEVYAICVQETCAEKHELLTRIQSTLGTNYVLFESCFFGYLGVCVFIRRDLIWYVSLPEKASISTRPALYTKGAVGISFVIFGSSFLFLSSHFKANTLLFNERVADYKKIIANLDLPKIVIQNEYHTKNSDLTTRFDNVFWAGDLNFRLNQKREIVERVIHKIRTGEQPNFEEMLAGDELKTGQSEGKLFQDFEEGRINFPPTYKYDVGKDHYDTSKLMRIPSYTDRILFRCKRKRSVNVLQYNHITNLRTSDHRAVYGLFEVKLKPGSDKIPLAAGLFNREIYIAGNQRRALHLEVKSKLTKEKSSRVCALM